MPHRPRRHGYEALDIWLATQESAKDALKRKDWNPAQQAHLEAFTDYATVNRTEYTDKYGKTEHRYRQRKTGRFVPGI